MQFQWRWRDMLWWLPFVAFVAWFATGGIPFIGGAAAGCVFAAFVCVAVGMVDKFAYVFLTSLAIAIGTFAWCWLFGTGPFFSLFWTSLAFLAFWVTYRTVLRYPHRL